MIAGPTWTLNIAYSLLCSDYFNLSANPPGLYFNATFSEKPDSAVDSPYPSHSTLLFPFRVPVTTVYTIAFICLYTLCLFHYVSLMSVSVTRLYPGPSISEFPFAKGVARRRYPASTISFL